MKLDELSERQSWTLQQKIDHSLGAIDQFLSRLDGKAYVAFSGGKDSTVLLDLCRILKPDIKATFINTGNEYPEIVRFVRELKNTEGYNVDIIYPKLKPQQIIEKYGFPLIGKEVASLLYTGRHYVNSKVARIVNGLEKDEGKFDHTLPVKYMALRDAPFDITHLCCHFLKKTPSLKYERQTGLHPIIGSMACESRQRRTEYLKQGTCNFFKEAGKRTKSLPLSIWLEEDIWAYIKLRGLNISDIYSKGAQRTGCMFCGFGCQFPDDTRLKMVLDMYPKMYDRFMNFTNNGVTYREAMREILAINGLKLPDEK